MPAITPEIDPDEPPSGIGCVECLATDGWWFHLPRCAHCGPLGCCEPSRPQHATAPAADTGPPIDHSCEPGEGWFWASEREEFREGPALAPPQRHPFDQPVPGPAGRVPDDWQWQLH